MPTPSIQTLTTDAQQILNLDSISSVRSVVAVALANANTGTPLNPNLTTQQLWDQFYQVVTRPKSDIESIIANQLMKFLYSPPAPGGAGADKQVIFNDGGVLAGDADFLWNKTTNLLTVTGSATISGDLTVDTSTLKVDSANNRVGIGTASPSSVLTLKNPAVSGEQTILNIQNGTGVTSITKLTYNQDTDALRLINETAYSGATLQLGVNGTDLTIDQSGNLGLGVTPSAWATTFNVKAFQTAGGSLFNFSNTVISLTQNSFYNTSGGYSYANNGFASEYYQMDGKHIWRTAASGTAGNAVTFTQAMTLDASGNLLVGVTSANASGGVLQLKSGITFPATQVASSDANTLDDYEEGTWTGTLKGSVSDPTTPVTATGRYTKVGRVVTVQISFSNADTNGASGAIGITGLPFAGVSGITQIGTFSTINGTTVTNGAIWAIDGSLTALNALSTDWNSLNHSAGTTRYFMLNLTYTVA